MFKFKEGDIVRGKDGHLYKVEDTAVDCNNKSIYFLRRVFYDYCYQYEEELKEFYGQIVNKDEVRSW